MDFILQQCRDTLVGMYLCAIKKVNRFYQLKDGILYRLCAYVLKKSYRFFFVKKVSSVSLFKRV